MTRAQVRALCQPGVSTRVIGFIASNLVNIFHAVLGQSDGHVALMNKLGDRLGEVGKLAYQLNIALGELVTSGNMDVTTTPCEAAFDPTTMEDSLGYPLTEGKRNIVLCTTELGLRKSEKVSGEGGVWWSETVLLKPKVALDSLLENLADPDAM
jgi:hypothetical protein